MRRASAGLREGSNAGVPTRTFLVGWRSMNPAPDREDFAREHQVFWMLVKGSRDHPVGRVYLAIQAALAYGRETVDVGWLMGEMMAQGRKTKDSSCDGIGAGGLAYFRWLYETELVEPGTADTHGYRFRRRSDGKEIVALLRTAADPRSLYFQQAYERERRKLEKKRGWFLAGCQHPAYSPGRGVRI